MSADKHPCIFSRQIKAIVYLYGAREAAASAARGGGGGTPIYGLYGYVPLNRVWFLLL